MSKFIEIPVNEEKCIINLDAIQSVYPLKEGGCEISFLEGYLKRIITQLPYSELLKLIWK